jgi:hypothetical protein
MAERNEKQAGSGERNRRPGVTSDPGKPVYDNPVGETGALDKSGNVLTDDAPSHAAPERTDSRAVPERGERPSAPRVRDSDRRVGQKPARQD